MVCLMWAYDAEISKNGDEAPDKSISTKQHCSPVSGNTAHNYTVAKSLTRKLQYYSDIQTQL